MKEIEGSYDEIKDWVMDPEGYFLIRIEGDDLAVGFCKEKNEVLVKITGKKPMDICFTAQNEGLLSRKDHASYLGKELQKAYIAKELGVKYVQDSELDLSEIKEKIK